MTTLETLKAARAKIADRKHWTQHESARDKSSRPVPPQATTACRWCATGAIRAVAANPSVGFHASMQLAKFCHEGTPWMFNDSHRHKEVLALFDKAIASLEAA